MLHTGPIALYCSNEVLEDDINKLIAEAFDVRRLDASKWRVESNAHDDLKRVLQLPAYYGGNLDALDDCMQDLVIPDEGGMAIVLAEYDDFARRDERLARGILDVLARGSRLLQVFGKTLVALVHTRDPDVKFGELGAITAWWNTGEFVRSNRGRSRTS